MKQGQWAAEWKRVRREMDGAFRKIETGNVFEKTYDTELKPCGRAVSECDKAFADYAECETTEEKRDVVKRLSSGHDSYRTARENHKKSLAKIAKRGSPELAKAVDSIDLKNDPIDVSIGDTIVAMLNFVSHAAREERKIENVSKSLSDEIKRIKKFVVNAQGDKKGKVFREGIADVGEGLHALLVDIDKMVRKKKEIDNAKAPPKKLVVASEAFTDPSKLECADAQGNPDFKKMMTVLKSLLQTASLVETWRKKTWPE